MPFTFPGSSHILSSPGPPVCRGRLGLLQHPGGKRFSHPAEFRGLWPLWRGPWRCLGTDCRAGLSVCQRGCPRRGGAACPPSTCSLLACQWRPSPLWFRSQAPPRRAVIPDATGGRAGSGPGGDASVQGCPDLCPPEFLSPWGCSGAKDQHPPSDPRVGGTAGILWGFRQRKGGRSRGEASLCSGSGVWPTL